MANLKKVRKSQDFGVSSQEKSGFWYITHQKIDLLSCLTEIGTQPFFGYFLNMFTCQMLEDFYFISWVENILAPPHMVRVFVCPDGGLLHWRSFLAISTACFPTLHLFQRYYFQFCPIHAWSNFIFVSIEKKILDEANASSAKIRKMEVELQQMVE